MCIYIVYQWCYIYTYTYHIYICQLGEFVLCTNDGETWRIHIVYEFDDVPISMPISRVRSLPCFEYRRDPEGIPGIHNFETILFDDRDTYRYIYICIYTYNHIYI